MLLLVKETGFFLYSRASNVCGAVEHHQSSEGLSLVIAIIPNQFCMPEDLQDGVRKCQ